MDASCRYLYSTTSCPQLSGVDTIPWSTDLTILNLQAPHVLPVASEFSFDGMESIRPVPRGRDPPRNDEGQIYCDHTDCKIAPPTFRRPGEWNKHMHEHNRRFNCHEHGCEKIRGFTYFSGLLRHQREVHKKNDTKKPLMCPYEDCNRSTSNGFTRQENLREHLRRRHKRKHNSPKGEFPHSDQSSDDLHSEVKQLCRKVQEIDARLEQLERIVADLHQAIPKPTMPEHGPQPTQAMPSLPDIPHHRPIIHVA